MMGNYKIPGTPSVLRTQGKGKREGLQCGVGDSENPRDSLSPQDSGNGKERGTAMYPRDSLSPHDSGDGKDRETAVWCRGQDRIPTSPSVLGIWE